MMRFSLRILLGSVILTAAVQVARADDRENALVIIDRAVRAHGGQDLLAKAALHKRSAKGTLVLASLNREISFTTELVVQLPDRLRDVIDTDVDGQKGRIIQVINKDQGWRSTGGAPQDLAKEEMEDVREYGYVIWLTTLVPLKDKKFDLAPVEDIKVNGQPALGVKVSSKGHADVKLYFDQKTRLLVKVDRQAREAGLTVRKEWIFAEPKEWGGLKLGSKWTELTNNKKSFELTITSYVFPEKVEAGVFDKP